MKRLRVFFLAIVAFFLGGMIFNDDHFSQSLIAHLSGLLTLTSFVLTGIFMLKIKMKKQPKLFFTAGLFGMSFQYFIYLIGFETIHFAWSAWLFDIWGLCICMGLFTYFCDQEKN